MNATALRRRTAVAASLPLVALVYLWLYGPMPQDTVDPGYHDFADHRLLLGIPNFWNVVTNLPFLAVALAGLRAFHSPLAFREQGERTAYGALLISLALIALGSGWYHLRPDNGSLFWDRLPMALGFSAVLAATVGERIGPRTGRRLLLPLLAAGALSVLYWRWADDLRFYLLVQFCAVAGLPLLLLLFPPRYTGTTGIAAMVGLYALALLCDRFDRVIATVLPTGGHPWKHLLASAAMLVYVATVAHRRPLPTRVAG